MICIYLETNFLLQTTLKQKDHRQAYQLLRLAENKKVKLIIPEFSISESYFALQKKITKLKKRKVLIEDLVKEAQKSSHTKSKFEKYESISTDIDTRIAQELGMLDSNIERVLKCVELISHNQKIHSDGIKFRSQLDLKGEPDAFIVAAIIWHSKSYHSLYSESILLTTDRKTIANKIEVKHLLSKNKIESKVSFPDCLKYLKSKGVF